MCAGPLKPKRSPAPPPPDPAVEAQQAEQKARETSRAKERKQEALSETIQRRKGGRGRRSLITGSSGGMGFYNEYL